MNIVEKIIAKKKASGAKPVTIAFLGDSVTQGCFECYRQDEQSIETVFDYQSAFSTRVREILNLLYPNVQINIINSGISGDRSANGLRRLEQDILAYAPDLCVVSFGLNDSGAGLEKRNKYASNIFSIVDTLTQNGVETIFLTQNSMNTYVSCHLQDDMLRNIAKEKMVIQNEGILDQYMQAGRDAAEQAGAIICDLSAVWKKLSDSGVDTTELLANKINHPIRQMHYYMAIKLIETIFEI
jgi:lysophospholipase L1-like esterase